MIKEPKTETRANKGRTPQDYDEIRFKASIMYIKDGLSQKQIADHLNICEPTLIKWRKAGNWDVLRPDLEILKQYKAASMYVTDGRTTGQIAMALSVSEIVVERWIYEHGWNVSKNLRQAQDTTAAVVDDFCQYFKKSFPDDAAKMEMMRNSYLQAISAKSLKNQ